MDYLAAKAKFLASAAMFSRHFTEVTEVNDLRFQKSLHLGVDHIKIYSHLRNELSKCLGG